MTSFTRTPSAKPSVTAEVSAVSISPRFRVDASTVEVAILGTAYVPFYSYTGSGLLWGFHLNMDQDGGQIQLVVDGNTVMSDVTSKLLNDLGMKNVGRAFHSREGAGSYFFYFPQPMRFSSNVTLSARRDTGALVRVQQRIVYITKES